MTDAKSLKEAIEQYEVQLSQVDTTLSSTPIGPNRDNLLSLKSDIEELISLTKESLQSLERNNIESKDEDEDSNSKIQDPLDKEYALFKAELEESSDDEESTEQSSRTGTTIGDIEDELKELEGMKCKAPYSNSWGGTGYHNAMVCSVHRNNNEEIKDIHDIKIQVFFLNPTHKKMIPCPYFLDGSCKFSDENCHYSHGEIVAFSSLQEYKDPDFRNLKMGSRVLTKQKNNTWCRSVVLKLPEKDGGEYRVKFEASGEIIEASLQDLLPLGDADLEMSDTSDDSDGSDSGSNSPHNSHSDVQLVHKSLLTLQSDEPLGNWERYTRGIGSKLMMQMGYVIGTGLGKRGDGRIQPVEATVLPAGKSLDHCMELREFAGGDKDLFSVERKMRKQQQKSEQQRERQYQKEKERENSNVFNFINKTLGDKPKDDNAAGSSRSKDKLRIESNYNLNVASFRVGEDISRLEKESSKLKESMARHTKGSALYNNIVMKYNEKQKELNNLRTSERNIIAEQNQRKDKAKLTIF
ncbi:PREDICTED: zinc finger CCCH-type with G patch domain-containing protein [Dinoponera quadriceps]|uniref:Zinc finger CCCH-type with G patch domain-containing protein n=1 Tax=Dinoponera quadriceps TaxID=609295 RepID=A0A6P3X756_DINQU|nr:PREDICTED: zinc finger CCCH-type with G patch domain-containing protein [Dinoponera quadriceps]